MKKNPCLICSVPMVWRPGYSHTYWRTRRYCSRRCFGVSNRKTPQTTCLTCATVFHSSPSDGRKYCSIRCTNISRIGRHHTDEHRARIARSLAGKPKTAEHRAKLSGANSHLWKGGITPLHNSIRRSDQYKEWRRHVFQRDDYTCQGCGERGGRLNADHELPFSLFPDLRFEILNGRTFCEDCHRKYGWSFFHEQNPRKGFVFTTL